MCWLCPWCSCCGGEPNETPPTPVVFSPNDVADEKNGENTKLIDESKQAQPIKVVIESNGQASNSKKTESVDESIRNLILEDWYHKDASIFEAITLLLWEGNEPGAFLVRPRHNKPEIPFILSIRTVEEGETRKPAAKHYAIFRKDDEFYISNGQKFDSVQELIAKYLSDIKNLRKLCQRIIKPCRRTNHLELSKELIEQYQLNRDEVALEPEPIDKGNFGQVYKGVYKGNDVAVKEPKNQDFDRKDLLKEVLAMKGLNHRNVIRLIGICEDDPILIVLEYMEFGSLKSYMKTHQLDNSQKCYLTFQLADGMTYLESQNIVHGDLAARNLLLNPVLTLKISDFCLSRFMFAKQYHSVLTIETELPLIWLAPESHDTYKFTSMSDVWSFGITAMEIYTNGKRPYSESNFMSLPHLLVAVKNNYRMPQAAGMPKEMYSIIETTWNIEPEDRPKFSDLTNLFQKFKEESEHLDYNVIAELTNSLQGEDYELLIGTKGLIETFINKEGSY